MILNKDLIRNSIEAIKFQREHPHRLTKTTFPQTVSGEGGGYYNDQLNKTVLDNSMKTTEQLALVEDGGATTGR
jgi:hypothetical protein